MAGVNSELNPFCLCADDCEVDKEPKGYDFQKCPRPEDINFGQIEELIFGEYTFENWPKDECNPTPAELDAMLAEFLTAVAEGKLERVCVEGDMPKPDSVQRDISKKRKINEPKDYVVNFTIDMTNAANRKATRKTQGCGYSPNFWFFDCAGWMHGSPTGINTSLVDSGLQIPRSTTDLQTIEGTAFWKSLCDPIAFCGFDMPELAPAETAEPVAG